MLHTTQQPETAFFHVSATLVLEGVKGSTLIFFPVKSIGYKSDFRSVTLTNQVRKSLDSRLKQTKIGHIVLREEEKEVLEILFGGSAEGFQAYRHEAPTLKPLDSLKK